MGFARTTRGFASHDDPHVLEFLADIDNRIGRVSRDATPFGAAGNRRPSAAGVDPSSSAVIDSSP